MEIDKDKLVDMYRTMLRIRSFEERVASEFGAGRIPGFVHLYTGEEAIATGVCAHLRPDDYITSTHRGHGHCIAKGGKTDRMMAEIYGKSTGYCKGKGGSMHIADVDIGILGANGVVAAGIVIATGAALSAKMRGTDQVAVSFFGDGAVNNGRFHEGLNMASAWKLPAVFVCENNLWAISTRTSTVSGVSHIASRAAPYSMPGITVEGNDVLAVYRAAGEAISRARKGEGPTLIECQTYRWRGHTEGDPQTYKPKEEIDRWLKKDPLPYFKDKLTEMEVLSVKELQELERQVLKEIDDAVAFAEASPLPAPEDTLTDVFA